MKVVLSLFTLFISAATVSGQLTWERLPGPNGTYNINSISVDQGTGRVYALSRVGGGIYTSSDAGLTWALKVNGIPPNIDIRDVLATGGVAYAAVDKVYKTTDDGDTWTELATSPAGTTNLHITPGGVLFTGSELSAGGQGIYRSTDGGATWEIASTGLPSYVIFFTYYRSVSGVTSDGSGNLLCSVNSGSAATEAGVYVSTNNGDSWTRSVTGLLEHVEVRPIASAPNGTVFVGVRNRIYRSMDGGTTWTQSDSLPMATTARTRAMSVNDANEVFAATYTGLYRASAGGIGWTLLTGSNLSSTSVEDVATGPAGMVYAGGLELWGGFGGMFRSTDGGGTWSESNQGMNNGAVMSLTVTPSGRIISGLGRGRVEYSTDGGTTFARTSVPYTGSILFAAITALKGNGHGAVVAGAGEGAFASTDDGVSWTKTSTVSDVRAFATDAGQNFYAGTGSGVLKSTDDGATWAPMGGGGNSYSVFVTAAGTVLSGTYNSGINRTTDGGATWTNSGTAVFGTITVGRFIQLTNGHVYVHTLFGLFRSTDDGASWAGVTGTPVGTQYRTLASHGGSIYLGSTYGVHESTDGGLSWNNYLDGLLWTILDYLAVSPDGHLFGSGGYGIYRTPEALTTSVELVSSAIPERIAISQNYPNPFNPATTIEFSVPSAGDVILTVYDALGRIVATLLRERKEPGVYRTTWDASGHPSGVYYCSIRADVPGGGEPFGPVRKMLLLR